MPRAVVGDWKGSNYDIGGFENQGIERTTGILSERKGETLPFTLGKWNRISILR